MINQQVDWIWKPDGLFGAHLSLLSCWQKAGKAKDQVQDLIIIAAEL